jgi:type VI secretion system secreted protein VgrG
LTIERQYHDGEGLAGAPYEVIFANGEIRKGTLDGEGRARLDDVPAGTANVRFGAMPGLFARKDLTATPNHLPKPGASDIESLIDKYSAVSKDLK